MKIKEILSEAKAVKQRLDPKCWKGKHKEGTKVKGGVRVNNCVPNESVEQGVAEGHADQQRQIFKKNGHPVGEVGIDRESSPGNGQWYMKYYPTGDDFAGYDTMEEAVADLKHLVNQFKAEGVAEDFEQQFDLIEEMVEALAEAHGVDADLIWEDFESVDDHELLDESAAWHRKAGKSKSGGLNKKGVASYRREHPGSKLQTAVTTKPSKLKKGSKAAKRRKSFCARMGGMKGAMKKPNGKPTRKALALRKWHC
jgi:hypothetical protein